MNQIQAAMELRKAVQFFIESFDADVDAEKMLEVASVYPAYSVGRAYAVKDVFQYGQNNVGDPQLYQVLQAHTSAEGWPPDATASLYKAIGLGEDGTPVWVQPLGTSDAYALGDVVLHNGAKWESIVADNVWEPGVYGWEETE